MDSKAETDKDDVIQKSEDDTKKETGKDSSNKESDKEKSIDSKTDVSKDEGNKTEDKSDVTVVVNSDNESIYLTIIAIASIIIVFLIVAVIYFAICKDKKELCNMTKTKSETPGKQGYQKSAKSGDDKEVQESQAPKEDKLTSILSQMRRQSVDSRGAL